MGDLSPNNALLSHPMNWALVAFSVVLLAIISHCIWKDKE